MVGGKGRSMQQQIMRGFLLNPLLFIVLTLMIGCGFEKSSSVSENFVSPSGEDLTKPQSSVSEGHDAKDVQPHAEGTTNTEGKESLREILTQYLKI